MGVTITAPENSFVQFQNMDFTHCIYGPVKSVLPVFDERDIAFQFFVDTDTEGEADNLSLPGSTDVSVALTDESGNTLTTFSGTPPRYRLDTLNIIYFWDSGVPNFDSYISVNQCFRLKVTVNGTEALSNKFKRINAYEACFTSVIEYGSDDNGFGFNYCAAATIPPGTGGGGTGGGGTGGGTGGTGGGVVCQPTRITFQDYTSIIIPYTSQMQDLYGALPTVQVWAYEAGELVRSSVEPRLDGYPPSQITITFTEPTSGLIIIK